MELINIKDLQDPGYGVLLGQYKRLKKPKGNPGGRQKDIAYLGVTCAFDIETTTIEHGGQLYNIMYIWQFQIGEEKTIYGRTWEDFRYLIGKLKEELNGLYLVAYVHNLSYEWQYLKGVFVFPGEHVFATASRKVIKCIIAECVELRDSLILTNMSLAAFTRKMNVEHQKLSGEEYNYNKIRYPWTHLTARELEYCINDVRGLVEAVNRQMERDGDTLYTIPLTSTGYPRREMKHAMRRYSKRALVEMQPTLEQYQLLRDCFRGGNTHANRFYAGKIIDSHILHTRILSADRSSSYPDVLMTCKYPMSGWRKGEATAENLRNLMHNGYAVMFRARITDIRLKDPFWPVPYLSVDKSAPAAASVDNGRILSAGVVTVALTDVDFRILLYEYAFSEIEILELYFTDYGYLPDPMRAVIRSYYEQKTALKGNDDPFQKLLYDKSKNILNGLFGMCAQDPLQETLLWTGAEFIVQEEDPAEILRKHAKRSFLNYAWGVWCTAWARYRLEQGIIIAGPQDFIYCDTDSVKYVDHGQDWSEFNRQAEEASKASGAYATDSNQVTHYMGVYEADGEYKRFSTLGAKRYAYEDMTGDLHITISGVSKKAAAELAKLENFKEGFTFLHPGKTESKYVDFPVSDQLLIDGHCIELTSYVIITETTYNLSLSESYRNLLRLIEKEEQ